MMKDHEGSREDGPGAVATAARALESEDPAAARAARVALLRMAHASSRPGEDGERADMAKALAAALASAKTDPARNAILETLGYAGGEETVEAVAACLHARSTRHMASAALVRNPSPSAARALSDAFEASDPSDAALRIALLAAMGLKKDAAAAQLLADAAEGGDPPEVRLAALEALGRNPMSYAYVHVFWGALPAGDVRGEDVPRGDVPEAEDAPASASFSAVRSRVWDCLLRVGDAFTEVGEVGSASDLFAEMLEAASSRAERCSALLGLGRAGRRTAPGRIFEALEDEDPQVRATAMTAIAELRGPTVVPAIARLLPKVDPSVKAGLLWALGRREEPEAAALAEKCLADEDATVREAAREALEAHRAAAAKPRAGVPEESGE